MAPKFGSSMRCTVCSKIVGFAEAVHRDEKVYHRTCFTCGGCNKVLDRGQGLRRDGEYFCNNCHNKHFGPMGFKKGVVKGDKVMKTVQMNMQPPFAHVAKEKPAAAAPAPTKAAKVEEAPEPAAPNKLHEFDVAVFSGDDLDSLKEYLTEGNVDFSSWSDEVVAELLDHVTEGRCEVGLDRDGNALRVASVAKVYVRDDTNNRLLFNPLNSFEDSSFLESRKEPQSRATIRLQKAIGDSGGKANIFEGAAYDEVFKQLGFQTEATQVKSSTNSKVEIPGAFVFETTFSPFKETPRDAGARVVAWRFSLQANGRMFDKTVPKTVKVMESTHFPGLKSEYHVHHLIVKDQLIAPLQHTLPLNEVTPITVDEVTNTGINTHWYVWLNYNTESPTELITQLQTIYKTNPKVAALVGDVDFNGPLAAAMGEAMLEESRGLKNF